MTLAEPQIRVTGDQHDLADILSGDLLKEAEERLRFVVNRAREEHGLKRAELKAEKGWEIYAYRSGAISISYGLNAPHGECVWRRIVHI